MEGALRPSNPRALSNIQKRLARLVPRIPTPLVTEEEQKRHVDSYFSDDRLSLMAALLFAASICLCNSQKRPDAHMRRRLLPVTGRPAVQHGLRPMLSALTSRSCEPLIVTAFLIVGALGRLVLSQAPLKVISSQKYR